MSLVHNLLWNWHKAHCAFSFSSQYRKSQCSTSALSPLSEISCVCLASAQHLAAVAWTNSSSTGCSTSNDLLGFNRCKWDDWGGEERCLKKLSQFCFTSKASALDTYLFLTAAMLAFSLTISWSCCIEICAKTFPAWKLPVFPSLTLPPWIPRVVETGICLEGKVVEAKVGRMKTNWAVLVKGKMHTLFLCGQQCQAILSPWFITAFRQ